MTGDWLLIGIGGFAGAVSRFAVSRFFSVRFPSGFPYGTLTVNVLGSFVFGFLIGAGASERWRAVHLVLGVGFVGAFTTFSTYSSESLQMLRQRQTTRFIAYQCASYLIAITAAALGWLLGKLL